MRMPVFQSVILARIRVNLLCATMTLDYSALAKTAFEASTSAAFRAIIARDKVVVQGAGST